MERNSNHALNRDDPGLLLKGLIGVCRAGHDGYMQAADSITSSPYKIMFAEYAHQRSRFASQLANAIADSVETGADDTAEGVFTQRWPDVEPALQGGDFGAIFGACEAGENAALNAYERVLELGLPDAVAAVVDYQYQQMVEARDRLHRLLEAYVLEHSNS